MEDGFRYGRIACDHRLVPAPGQYLLASTGPESILPVPIFYTDSVPQGFMGPVPDAWKPGDTLHLRGPLGRGFSMPTSARRVGLIAFEGSFSRLHGLIRPALAQNASVVLVTSRETSQLPDEVEVQPVSAAGDVLAWADYLAVDLRREDLPRWREEISRSAYPEVQVLVQASMPCGGIAECGVCSLNTRNDWRLVCRDGPVFDLRAI
jgi:dihydroorotate dehydrogenase electron transfer subunit